MSVFLRTDVVVGVHLVGCGAVEVDETTCITVDVVFTRSAAEIFYLIHIRWQAETYADTWYVQFGRGQTLGILSRCEGSHQSCF